MIRVHINVTGARGTGKTYVLNRLADEIRLIQSELPGRQIELVLSETHEYPRPPEPRQ